MHNPYQLLDYVGALSADRLNSIIRTNSTLPSKHRFSSSLAKYAREDPLDSTRRVPEAFAWKADTASIFRRYLDGN